MPRLLGLKRAGFLDPYDQVAGGFLPPNLTVRAFCNHKKSVPQDDLGNAAILPRFRFLLSLKP